MERLIDTSLRKSAGKTGIGIADRYDLHRDHGAPPGEEFRKEQAPQRYPQMGLIQSKDLVIDQL